MSTTHIIGNGALVAHAFNADLTELAVSINTQDVYILSVPKSPNQKFQLINILKDHTSLVTSIDWAPKSDSIITCSSDRSAYVWIRQPDKSWKHTLVMLHLNRAVTSIRWSPSENKFAAGSGAKVLAICSFEHEYDCWNAKHIKKPIRSTVTCVDWHPNNMLVACGSTDFKVRIYSAFLEKAEPNSTAKSTWGEHTNFGNMLFTESSGNGGWVHAVAFSADGVKLVWATHSSTVFVADSSAGSGSPAVCSIRCANLPFVSTLWVAPSTILAAGHDCAPFTIYYDAGAKRLTFGQMLAQKDDSKGIGKLTAMRKFQEIDRTATSDLSGTKLTTVHQNTIREMRVVDRCGDRVNRVSSIGLDGLLVFWDLDALSQQMSDLYLK